jgi:hypothetical protein
MVKKLIPPVVIILGLILVIGSLLFMMTEKKMYMKKTV